MEHLDALVGSPHLHTVIVSYDDNVSCHQNNLLSSLFIAAAY